MRRNLVRLKRLPQRAGFGVQSPFAFSLITHLIHDRTPFYSFGELKAKEKEWTGDSVHGKAENNEPLYLKQLLFKLVNFAQPQTILHAGIPSAASLYLQAAKRNTIYRFCGEEEAESRNCTKEESLAAEQVVKEEKSRTEATPSVEQKVKGEVKQTEESLVTEKREKEEARKSKEAQEEQGTIDFLYLHHFRQPEYVRELFQRCAAQANDRSLFVVHGIQYSREMRRLWEEMKAHPAVKVTFDLYDAGLLFFDPKKQKQHFVVGF